MLPTVALIVAALLVVEAAPASSPSSEELTAAQVLERMAATYSGCKSYRDVGLVKTVFVYPHRSWTVTKFFTTAFVRPDHFRFAYQEGESEEKRRYIVWRQGAEVRTWWDLKSPPNQPKDSLGLALAAATGVSSSSAHTVPALLLPGEVGGRRLTEMTEISRSKDALQEGSDCMRIEGKYGGYPTQVWIEKKSFLIRRIDTQVAFDKFRTEQTTTYVPAVDQAVSDDLLEFTPPG